MRSVFTAGARYFVIGFAIVIFLTMNQAVARADIVTFQGTTDGSFNSTGFSSNPTLLGLTFNGTTFPIGTVDTNTSSLLLAGSTINIGSFTLTGNFPTSTSNTFTLRFVVTFPPSVVGRTQPSAFAREANLIGLPDGSVIIDFLHNDPIILTVEINQQLIESFSLIIDDIRIQPGQTVALLGAVAPVPEPMTLLMLSTGLAGVGAGIWKRRKRKV